MLPYRYSRLGKILLTVFFLAFILYGYYEARAILYGPRITTTSELLVLHEAFTKIEGKAENIAEMRMNGAPVEVTEEGAFSEPYLAAPGESRVVLDAKDKYGRTRTRTIEVMYIPQPTKVIPVATTTVQYATTSPAISPAQ